MPPQTAGELENSNSGFFSNSLLPDFFTSVHAFLTAAQDSEVGAKIGDLSVFSRMDGVLRHVEYLYVDAKFDSQRRRQNRETAGVLGVAF